MILTRFLAVEDSHSKNPTAKICVCVCQKVTSNHCSYMLHAQSQEAQLPQRNSASAAHMEGGRPGPPAHSPFAPLAIPMRMVESKSRKAHFKINRAFKVIQDHPYWRRHESRMVCCRNVQLMMWHCMHLQIICCCCFIKSYHSHSSFTLLVADITK